MQKYRVSNVLNGYSSQRYPLRIVKTEWIDLTGSPLFPNGAIVVGFDTDCGYCQTTFLRAHKSAKGYYTRWGGFRLYAGYRGPVHLLDVPAGSVEGLRSLAERYGSIVD